MCKIKFTKVVASGNDFVVIESSHKSQITNHKSLAQKICDRKYGIGADGLLILEKSKIADIKMRIFNADGSEAEMCGNGARCVALFRSQVRRHKSQVLKIETKAGIIESEVKGNNVKIKLTDPKNIKLNIPILVNGRKLRVNCIDTGVPHVVIFVQGIDNINAVLIGRNIRYHKKFAPKGTNVDFIEILGDSLKIRTYERGVEDETLACGTGTVASALIAYRLSPIAKVPIDVLTRSGEILKVYFKKANNSFREIWLEGKVRIVCKGEYYV